MKKYFNIIVILFLAICCSSCLDANLEELDTYEGKEISGVVGVYHRYYDDSYIHNGSGEQAVKQANLSVADILIDKEGGTCTFSVSVPGNFPKGEAEKVSSQALVVIVNISTAAIVSPIEGAPQFGKPGDWSKPNRYKVKAANGDEQIWTVSLTFK